MFDVRMFKAIVKLKNYTPKFAIAASFIVNVSIQYFHFILSVCEL